MPWCLLHLFSSINSLFLLLSFLLSSVFSFFFYLQLEFPTTIFFLPSTNSYFLKNKYFRLFIHRAGVLFCQPSSPFGAKKKVRNSSGKKTINVQKFFRGELFDISVYYFCHCTRQHAGRNKNTILCYNFLLIEKIIFVWNIAVVRFKSRTIASTNHPYMPNPL